MAFSALSLPTLASDNENEREKKPEVIGITLITIPQKYETKKVSDEDYEKLLGHANHNVKNLRTLMDQNKEWDTKNMQGRLKNLENLYSVLFQGYKGENLEGKKLNMTDEQKFNVYINVLQEMEHLDYSLLEQSPESFSTLFKKIKEESGDTWAPLKSEHTNCIVS